jgi:formate-dependent nitrite reductase membrane component NrfD
MPVVFIFSAMVSGIAAVLLIYMFTAKMRKMPIDMPCVDTTAMYLFYIFILDFSLEMLDLIHRVYEADESFRTLNFMVHTKLYFSQIVLQICIGTLVPLLLLAIVQVTNLPAIIRKRIYVISGCLVQVAVFSMRWNVVIGGQLFSKSFLGYTTYKMALVTKEGLLMAIFLTLLPLAILWVLLKLLPPWPDKELAYIEAAAAPTT